MNETSRFNPIYFVIAAFGVLLLHDFWLTSRTVSTLPYSEFQKLLREGKIREIVAHCYERAKDSLNRNRAVLEESARLLPTGETLEARDLGPLLGRIILPAPGSV